jgi:hypothetical protein
MKLPAPALRAQDSALASKRHELARAQTSGWHYLLLTIGVAASAAVWGAILLPFYALRQSLVPPDAFLSGGTNFGNTLFLLPPMFPAFAIGLMLARSIVRRIPAARTALEPELGDDTKTVSGLKKYAKWGRLALIAVLPLCLFGAMSTWATTPERIVVRPIFSATVHSYDWSRVKEIETGCTQARIETNYHFVLDLADGTRVDLMQDAPWAFVAAYPKIQLALAGRSYGFSNAAFVGSSCSTHPRASWQKMLTDPPTS